jgi:glutamate-1-semialdehyde aminotransferase
MSPSLQSPTLSHLSTQQQRYLEEFISRYTQQTTTSKHYAQTYRSVLADNKTATGFSHALKELFYPIVSQQALGSRIWDIDDNEYIDLVMGFGINLLGHNPPSIQAARREQLERGIPIGPQPEQVGEVAQLICDLTGTERIAFSNTGTEAVMTAIRLARAATHRPKIAYFSGSYHGHFDGTLLEAEPIDGVLRSRPLYAGVPANLADDTLVLEYGNSRSLDLIQSHAHELAAVLVEPVQTSNPGLQPQVFLQDLRTLTQSLGVALIFDEMVTGFRIHLGGAQAWFGVNADLVTYGKIVGGGLPIGVIAGKAAYLDQIDGGMWSYGDESYPRVKTTFFAGTYCKHPLSITAAKAVLTYLKSEGTTLQQQLNQRTTHFVQRLNDYFTGAQVPLRMINFGSLFGVDVSTPASFGEATDLPITMNLLYYHLVDRGVLIRGSGGYLSTAHTDDDLDHIIQAIQNSIEALRSGGFLLN